MSYIGLNSLQENIMQMSYLLALPCRHIFSIWDGGAKID